MNKKQLRSIYSKRIKKSTKLKDKETDEIEIIKLETEIQCYKHFLIALKL